MPFERLTHALPRGGAQRQASLPRAANSHEPCGRARLPRLNATSAACQATSNRLERAPATARTSQ
eukprot:363325-Chlamydomonas_euryale.AAC.4